MTRRPGCAPTALEQPWGGDSNWPLLTRGKGVLISYLAPGFETLTFINCNICQLPTA